MFFFIDNLALPKLPHQNSQYKVQRPPAPQG